MDSPPPSAPPPSASPPGPSLNPVLQPLPLPRSPSPRRRSKRRPAVIGGIVEARRDLATPPRNAKSRAAAAPRISRRTRRRAEEDVGREERTDGSLDDDDIGRTRKRKRKRSKHKVASGETPRLAVLLVPSSNPSPPEIASKDRSGGLDGSWEQVVELIMWKNVAKSTLWFGFGSTLFLSSCFSRESSFSIVLIMSHIGLLVLGSAFIKNTIGQRQQCHRRGNLQLTEENILLAARVILPVVNAALTKIQDIFSGDPLRTLKVAPILLLGAKYGHLITLWRLLVTGFYVSFTLPKLYLCYTQQVHQTAENAINWVQEAWKSCRCKRLVAASAATIFWNLCSIRTRAFAVFIFIVMLRCHHQQHVGEVRSGKESKGEEKKKGTVIAEQKSHMMHLN